MSVKAMNAVFDHSEARLGTRLVLLAIADNADDHGVAWPGVKRIAAKAKVSERAVQYALAQLDEMGEMDIYTGKSEYGTNLYHIRLPGLMPIETKGVQILHPAFQRAGLDLSTAPHCVDCTGVVKDASPKPK